MHLYVLHSADMGWFKKEACYWVRVL